MDAELVLVEAEIRTRDVEAKLAESIAANWKERRVFAVCVPPFLIAIVLACLGSALPHVYVQEGLESIQTWRSVGL